MQRFKSRRPTLSLISLVVILLATACVSRQWQGRIGNYSYDQAVAELGRPDHESKKPDGTVEADWIRTRSSIYTELDSNYHVGTGASQAESSPRYVERRLPERGLRLMFRPDGKLAGAKSYVR